MPDSERTRFPRPEEGKRPLPSDRKIAARVKAPDNRRVKPIDRRMVQEVIQGKHSLPGMKSYAQEVRESETQLSSQMNMMTPPKSLSHAELGILSGPQSSHSSKHKPAMKFPSLNQPAPSPVHAHAQESSWASDVISYADQLKDTFVGETGVSALFKIVKAHEAVTTTIQANILTSADPLEIKSQMIESAAFSLAYIQIMTDWERADGDPNWVIE